MSIRVLTIVWDRYPHGGSKLLTMLALADWAGPDGGRIYPSMKTLSNKIRMSERQTIRIMRDLCTGTDEKPAFLQWLNPENSGGRNVTNRYRIKLETLTNCPIVEIGNPDRSSVNPDTQGVNPDTAMSGEPLEPLKPLNGGAGRKFDDWIEAEPRTDTLRIYIDKMETLGDKADQRELTRARAELEDLLNAPIQGGMQL